MSSRSLTNINSLSLRLLAAAILGSQLLLATPQNVHTDNATGFMWQDVPENRGVIHTWDEAKEYCDRLDHAGYDDWWLPSESELFTIVDTSRPAGRKIQPGFVHFKPGAYWTSSTYAWNAPDAWAIDFGSGTSYSLEKSQHRFARCVRCTEFKRCLQLFYERY